MTEGHRHVSTLRGDRCPWAVSQGETDIRRLICMGYPACATACERRDGHLFWEKRAKRRAARERGPRNFPRPTGGMRGKRGYCQWCGEIVRYHKGQKNGEIDLRRGWHDGRETESDCLYAFYLHTRPDVQRRFVEERDGQRCWDCGEAPERWLRGEWESSVYEPDRPRGTPLPTYISVTRVTALELDHDTPLWSVANLPDDDRAVFFGPANLRLRCARCHGAKTAREAAERARIRAI